MNDKLNYPGKELEIFDKAIVWRKYLFYKIKKYFGKEILEVGAGMGSFTKTYFDKNKRITLSELDPNLIDILKKKFKNNKNVSLEFKFTKKINSRYNTILYISVLEHIKNDTEEIKVALSKVKDNGYLVICVPAHNYMFSRFDKEIGHFRRYHIDYFKKLKIEGASIEDCYMLDSTGWLMYFLNRIIFKNEDYPSKLKVLIWDRLFVPISIFLDFFSFYKFGKNIICIIKKD